jgi:chromosome segregation ATPase
LAKERIQQNLQQQIADHENTISLLKVQIQQQSLRVDRQDQQSSEPDANEPTRLVGATKQAKEDLDYYQKQISAKQKDLHELNQKIALINTQLMPAVTPVVTIEKRKDGLSGTLPSWLE